MCLFKRCVQASQATDVSTHVYATIADCSFKEETENQECLPTPLGYRAQDRRTVGMGYEHRYVGHANGSYTTLDRSGRQSKNDSHLAQPRVDSMKSWVDSVPLAT